MIAWLLRRMILSSLRQSFRRVCWVGPMPDLPPNTPVVIYANHHYFHDSYLLWLVIEKMLNRRSLVWMAEWDAFPFFAALGAYPFPSNNPRRRAVTVRQTCKAFQAHPESMLIYYPEGTLHPPDEGLLPFSTDTFKRLDRVFPAKVWWPVALHITWWGEERPTALLAGGQPHTDAASDAQATLETLWHRLQTTQPGSAQVLLEGKTSSAERWRFTYLTGFFRRYL